MGNGVSVDKPLQVSATDGTIQEDIGLHRQQGVLAPCEGGGLNEYKDGGAEATEGFSNVYKKGTCCISKVDEENHRGVAAAVAGQACTEYDNLEQYVKNDAAYKSWNGTFSGPPERKSVSWNTQGNLRRSADQPTCENTPGRYELVEQVSDKALTIVGDGLLEKEQLEARPKCATVDSKVVKVMGSSRMATNQLRRRLGEGMSQEQARALKHQEIRDKQIEEMERETELQQILELDPPEGDPITHQVHYKAISLMGDKVLDKQQLLALPVGAKVDHKAVKILGTAKLMGHQSPRALIMLGDEMEPHQVAEMIKVDRGSAVQKEKQAEQEHRERIETIMNMPPPKRHATQILEQSIINKKVICQMGDEYLQKRSLGFCPNNSRGNKKVTLVLGSTQVAAKKAEQILDGK